MTEGKRLKTALHKPINGYYYPFHMNISCFFFLGKRKYFGDQLSPTTEWMFLTSVSNYPGQVAINSVLLSLVCV